MSEPTVEDFAKLAERVGPEPGWTDKPEYIQDPENVGFRIMGRWFLKRPDGVIEALD